MITFPPSVIFVVIFLIDKSEQNRTPSASATEKDNRMLSKLATVLLLISVHNEVNINMTERNDNLYEAISGRSLATLFAFSEGSVFQIITIRPCTDQIKL